MVRQGIRSCLAAAVAFGAVLAGIAPAADAAGYAVVDPPRALGEIALVGAAGKIDASSLGGRWTFLAIGYTHCPDVCPMLLAGMAALRDEWIKTASASEAPRMMFVSVDPARDTPQFLGEYVGHFGDGFLGATGSRPAIDRLVKTLGAYYRLGRKDEDGFYPVDHSAELYLLDPRLRLRAKFRPPIEPARTARDIRAIAAAGNASRAGIKR